MATFEANGSPVFESNRSEHWIVKVNSRPVGVVIRKEKGQVSFVPAGVVLELTVNQMKEILSFMELREIEATEPDQLPEG